MEENENSSRIPWLVWVRRVSMAIGVAFIMSAVPYRAIEDHRKLDEMSKELNKVRYEISELKADIHSRWYLIQSLTTKGVGAKNIVIENSARERLQMLYPHEKIFRLDGRGGPQ